MQLLEDKLFEEIKEFQAAQNGEELADILEVVFAIGEKLGHTNENLLELRRKKAEKRGGFSLGLFLESVDDASTNNTPRGNKAS